MDEIVRRIQEKLLQRGNAERQRAEEWQRSLKPTIYRGNNLFQELGGEPLEGRYLGQVGLVPGQSVPNIGRNPNKPVIPGLPVESEPATEEGGVIEKSGIAYSAIFTREVPSGRTQWTDLEMLQRSVGIHDDWVEGTVNIRTASVNGIMNDRKYYYWNGSTIQELFTHQTAELIDSGTVAYNQITDISTFPRLGNLENGMAKINHPINEYLIGTYVVVFTWTGGTPALRIVTPSSYTDLAYNQIESTGKYYTESSYSQVLLDSISTGDWKLVQFNPDPSAVGLITFELYKVYSDGSYFTTTQDGTAFAHITNGNEGDGRTRIRYFFGTGRQPSTLTQTNLSQTDIDTPGFELPYASFDWRSPWLTTTSSLVNNLSQESFNGLIDSAIQYGSLEASGGLAYFYYEQTAGALAFVTYIFNGDGTASTFSNAITYNASLYDSDTGEVQATDGDDIDLTWPRIDLASFGTEGFDWYIEDICLPDWWTKNRIANAYWLFPMIAIYPYHKKIFF